MGLFEWISGTRGRGARAPLRGGGGWSRSRRQRGAHFRRGAGSGASRSEAGREVSVGGGRCAIALLAQRLGGRTVQGVQTPCRTQSVMASAGPQQLG